MYLTANIGKILNVFTDQAVGRNSEQTNADPSGVCRANVCQTEGNK